jgi:hypothetical protein
MPPYIRRRVFLGWDWFTPRAIQHLTWRERERLIGEALEAVRSHPHSWLMDRLLPSLGALAMLLWTLPLFLGLSFTICLLSGLLLNQAQVLTCLIWRHRRFREALRKKLLDAGIRPRICYECGYQVEGFEGNECPACDAPLLRQPDSPRPMS